VLERLDNRESISKAELDVLYDDWALYNFLDLDERKAQYHEVKAEFCEESSESSEAHSIDSSNDIDWTWFAGNE